MRKKWRDGPYNHAEMQNIKNYSGKTEGYANNFPNILRELGMEDESSRFELAAFQGTFTVVDEMVRLVIEYAEVRARFGKASLEIIAALYFKGKNVSLNERVDGGESEWQDILPDESALNPEQVYLEAEENERLRGLTEQMREPCIRLVKHEFAEQDEAAFVAELTNRDFQDLCALFQVYTGKGGHNKDSELFKLYCETTGIPMTDERLLGPLHTQFAKKIRYIFENMRKDAALRRIHDEIE